MSQVATALYAVVDHRGWLGSLWPRSAPVWMQVLVGLVIVDLGLYLVHRASHGVGWLWRLHAFHHSPRRVYWINGQRRHVVHELVEGLPGLTVLGAARCPRGRGSA